MFPKNPSIFDDVLVCNLPQAFDYLGLTKNHKISRLYVSDTLEGVNSSHATGIRITVRDCELPMIGDDFINTHVGDDKELHRVIMTYGSKPPEKEVIELLDDKKVFENTTKPYNLDFK